jgi:hypothetical protein
MILQNPLEELDGLPDCDAVLVFHGRGGEDPEGCGDCDCKGSTEKLVDHWRAFSLCVAGPVGLADAAACPGTCYRRNGLEDAERALTRVSVRLATGEKTEKSYLFVIRFAEEMMLGAPWFVPTAHANRPVVLESTLHCSLPASAY